MEWTFPSPDELSFARPQVRFPVPADSLWPYVVRDRSTVFPEWYADRVQPWVQYVLFRTLSRPYAHAVIPQLRTHQGGLLRPVRHDGVLHRYSRRSRLARLDRRETRREREGVGEGALEEGGYGVRPSSSSSSSCLTLPIVAERTCIDLCWSILAFWERERKRSITSTRLYCRAALL